MFIPDADIDILPIPDLGFRIQGSKKHRIPDPDPQHCAYACKLIKEIGRGESRE